MPRFATIRTTTNRPYGPDCSLPYIITKPPHTSGTSNPTRPLFAGE